MLKHKHVSKKIDWKKRRKSVAIPNQSMTIKQIVERFVKGIPSDVEIKKGVYLNQVDFDLDKMSRMDATDKAYEATQFASAAEEKADEIEAHEKATKERKKKRDIEEATKKAAEKAPKTDPPVGSEKGPERA